MLFAIPGHTLELHVTYNVGVYYMSYNFLQCLSPSLQEQLLQLYKLAVKDDQLMVTIVPIQQQRGPEDCGLYSKPQARGFVWLSVPFQP